jgi:hypothetical protein
LPVSGAGVTVGGGDEGVGVRLAVGGTAVSVGGDNVGVSLGGGSVELVVAVAVGSADAVSSAVAVGLTGIRVGDVSDVAVGSMATAVGLLSAAGDARTAEVGPASGPTPPQAARVSSDIKNKNGSDLRSTEPPI